jgi:hypothetical protein
MISSSAMGAILAATWRKADYATSLGLGKPCSAQMLDDAATEEAGPAEHGDDAHAHEANVRSILLAMMKSFSCSPLIFFVLSETVA